MINDKRNKFVILTSLSLIFLLQACNAPRVPMQNFVGMIENYNQSQVLKVLSVKEQGSINYYQDGTIALTNVPFVQQGNDNTCGQAILTMILNYWGINISYQSIVNETNPANLPTDLNRITSYLRKKGLYAQDYRKARLSFVKNRILKGIPVIILLDFGSLQTEHYVIATGYNDVRQELIFSDPVDGPNMRLPYSQIEMMWENRSLKNLGIFGDKYDQVAFDVSID